MIKDYKKIFICATEQSGDNIAENIIKEIISLNPKIIIDGVGGHKMKVYMNEQFYTLNDFKSIGIIEVLFSLFKYIKIINKLSNIVYNNSYDLIITIDSPDFNYPLCKKIKENGFRKKIIQIVAPSVWAWRQSRAKKFALIYDHLFTLFSFENKFFEKYNLNTTCIGHPIFYIKKNSYIDENKDLIAFLPGSRTGEIKSLFKFYRYAYEVLLSINPNYKIFIPTLPHLHKDIKLMTKNWLLETIITTDKIEQEKLFTRSKKALVCSGTASIEVAKRGIPQLVIYKLNFLTEFIASFFVKVKFANIINILENKMIITELTNSKLKKDTFISLFKDLILNDKKNLVQTTNVNKVINKIEKNISPHKIIIDKLDKFI